MIIYGKQAVLEALRQRQALRVLVADGLKRDTVTQLERLARETDVPLEIVPRIDLDRALSTTQHQGVAAMLPEVTLSDPEEPFELARTRGERLLLVICDHLSDPRNYGAIIRSAEVLGAHGVVSETRRSAPLSATVVKTAAGATSYLPLVNVTNLARYIESLKSRGVWIYGTDAAATTSPASIDWDRDTALVIGAEGRGLRRLVRERCDDLLAIPMRGRVGSLNASVAAGILLYCVVTARGS
ncbi:MAG: 23S rRNA (guanosine(2251)-2'-O)-methyltransferase RlmB [Trueperaceae bacterium]|nr:MAG: 23S rRNA (guanosine(2251)-2'-O)-methyltransferase RlmB [Trueperaceae bacterium]